MEKIILLTGKSERDEKLVSCLRKLFPDCEIELKSKDERFNFQEGPDNSDCSGGELNLDKKLSKYMSFL